MPSKIKKVKVKPENPKPGRRAALPRQVKQKTVLSLEHPVEEEEFRPPRIPKFLKEEEDSGKKKRKSKEVLDEVDNEPVYTDDYDNTIYSIEY